MFNKLHKLSIQYLVEGIIGLLVGGCILMSLIKGIYEDYYIEYPRSSMERDSLEIIEPFDNNCVVDNAGILNVSNSYKKDLIYFYNKTGCQPYIVTLSSDIMFESGIGVQEFADKYFKEHYDNKSNGILYIYLVGGESQELGYDAISLGMDAYKIFDVEAQEILWTHLRNFSVYNDGVPTAFRFTANTIMKPSISLESIFKYLVIGVVIIVIICLLFLWWMKKRQAEKERAEETIRILNAGKDQALFEDSDLMSKYK